MVDFHDRGPVALIIEVIGLMCDGQHKEMQNYLREQKERISDVNIVEEITSFLYEYSKRRVITSDILPLMAAVFQTLIELCSGNFDNSEVIFQKQILSIINFFLQIDITNIKLDKKEEQKYSKTGLEEMKKIYTDLRIDALKLKAAVVELLEAMLERVCTGTEKFTHQITEGLDIQALHYSLVDFLILKDDEDLKKREEDDNALRALFKTYSVINHLIASDTCAGSKFGKVIPACQGCILQT